MTSLWFERDSLARRLGWPARLVGRAAGMLALSVATLLLIVMFMLLLCVAVRGLRRWSLAEDSHRISQVDAPRRVLIAGAGRHGLSIARELTAGDVPGVELVGF